MAATVRFGCAIAAPVLACLVMAAPAAAGERGTREDVAEPTTEVVEVAVPDTVAGADIEPRPAPVPEPAPEPPAPEPPAPEPPAPEPPAPEPPAPEPPAPEPPAPEPPAPEPPAPEPKLTLVSEEEIPVDDAVESVEPETTSPAAGREPVVAAPETSNRPAAPAVVPATPTSETEVIDYVEVASVEAAATFGVPSAPAAPASKPSDRGVTLVQSNVGPRVSATEEFATRALAGSLLPARTTGVWSTLGRAAARFGPWFMLLLIAQIIHGVAHSALADKVRAGRRA